ncbi:hypothetical protein [Parasitella parasitica]|uniref:Uncharacterized protein n=1 Tax=Parasitella parasitica TaxID=35722 RepID=A0A0B7NKT1_9FUNG|nr:hypothetical protein [Parasitella parasitica]
MMARVSVSDDDVEAVMAMNTQNCIGITGLVSQDFSQVGPRIPDPIDPDHVKPNDDSYGSEIKRAPFGKSLNKLLATNSKIDLKNICYITCVVPGNVD